MRDLRARPMLVTISLVAIMAVVAAACSSTSTVDLPEGSLDPSGAPVTTSPTVAGSPASTGSPGPQEAEVSPRPGGVSDDLPKDPPSPAPGGGAAAVRGEVIADLDFRKADSYPIYVPPREVSIAWGEPTVGSLSIGGRKLKKGTHPTTIDRALTLSVQGTNFSFASSNGTCDITIKKMTPSLFKGTFECIGVESGGLKADLIGSFEYRS